MKYIRKYQQYSQWEDDEEDRLENVPVVSWIVNDDEVMYDHLVPLVLTSTSNPEVFTILDEAGIEHAKIDGYTAAELGVITESEFNTTALDESDNEFDCSIFYNSNIETFDEFQYFTGLTSLVMFSFSKCTNLSTITIPSSVTTIGLNAFQKCSSLTSITISNSVTYLEAGAFIGCTNLSSITIPNSVTTIGVSAFQDCSSLTSITIPNSVTDLGLGAFSGCTRLASIVVNGGNTIYDSRNNCNAIIETATNDLISGCKNTIIPNSVTTIDVQAFFSCKDLTSITIPNSVTKIEQNAFGGCINLVSVTSRARTAPTINWMTFVNIKSGGTLHVPSGSNYSTWMQNSNYYLGKYNWTIAYDA